MPGLYNWSESDSSLSDRCGLIAPSDSSDSSVELTPSESEDEIQDTRTNIGTEPRDRIPRRLFAELHLPPPKGESGSVTSYTTASSEHSARSSIDAAASPRASHCLAYMSGNSSHDFNLSPAAGGSISAPAAVRDAVGTPVVDFVVNMPSETQGGGRESRFDEDSTRDILEGCRFFGLCADLVPIVRTDTTTGSAKGARKAKISVCSAAIVFWSILAGFFLNSFIRYSRTGESLVSTVVLSAIFAHKGVVELAARLVPQFPGRKAVLTMLSYSIALLLLYTSTASLECAYTESNQVWSCRW